MAHVSTILGSLKMKICILIPVLNESRTIGFLVEQLRQRGLDCLVIDDGSTDRSGMIAKEKGAVVISHQEKQGKGASLKEGFEYILKNNFDAVIAMDGDGQHAVEDLDPFLRAAEENPRRVITGNRMSNAKNMPRVRYLTNRFMSSLISFVCKQKVPDTQCGYRYIHRDILNILKLRSNDFEIESEILIQASRKDFQIHSVPIKTIYQDETSQIHPFKDTVRFIIYFTKELFSRDGK